MRQGQLHQLAACGMRGFLVSFICRARQRVLRHRQVGRQPFLAHPSNLWPIRRRMILPPGNHYLGSVIKHPFQRRNWRLPRIRGCQLPIRAVCFPTRVKPLMSSRHPCLNRPRGPCCFLVRWRFYGFFAVANCKLTDFVPLLVRNDMPASGLNNLNALLDKMVNASNQPPVMRGAVKSPESGA